MTFFEENVYINNNGLTKAYGNVWPTVLTGLTNTKTAKVSLVVGRKHRQASLAERAGFPGLQ
jgi:hypothetical protein